MCGKPVDSLPLDASFAGSWPGIGLGVLIIIGIVAGVFYYQSQPQVKVAQNVGTPPPTLTATPTSRPTRTLPPTPTLSPTPSPTLSSHTVEAGENPSTIAELYGVSSAELIAINSIYDVQSLTVGQVLLIPPTPKPEELDEEGKPKEIVYTVRPGDTLLAIAINHATTIDAIVGSNPGLERDDIISEGQQLTIPLSTPTATPTPTITPTPTPTPGPPYVPPDLLSPAEGAVVSGSSLFFNWTATGILNEDEFYVLRLTWSDQSRSEQWLKNNSYRYTLPNRPLPGPITWTVAIMRQTGVNTDTTPAGTEITPPGQTRRVEWR
jgi:LysM repeat protein